MEESYSGRGEELQIESWNECDYGQKGLANNGCVCDHKRTKSEDARSRYAH
jgi:hypothetical protein